MALLRSSSSVSVQLRAKCIVAGKLKYAVDSFLEIDYDTQQILRIFPNLEFYNAR